jgi:hypothetical protein
MAIPHGCTTRVILDRYDLSGDMNEATISIDHPAADKTGFGESSKSFVSGQHSWKLDVKGWYNSAGSVSAAGSAQPDGTAGSDLALAYLSNLGTAPSIPNKVLGYFPNGCGTGMIGYAGIAGINGVSRGANINNAVGITAGFIGNGPVTRVTSLGERKCTVAGGSTGAIDIGVGSVIGDKNPNRGAYCFFWILGTVDYSGAGTTAVYGTIQASDVPLSGYVDLAIFGGTVASAYAILATCSPTTGSIQQYINFSYGSVFPSNGTIMAAIGRMA